MREEHTTLTKKMEIKTPMVPNFLKVGDMMVGISEFSEEELKKVGQAFTRELIKKSKKALS